MNEFLNEMNKTAKTENGALSYASSLSVLVDQFGQAATFRDRFIDDVFNDQFKLWSENPDAGLRFPFYLRMVTRKIKFENNFTTVETDKIQKGQGVKDEAFKRYLWLAKFHKEEFEKNLWAIPVIGSWKDVWTLLYYDEMTKIKALDKLKFFTLLQEGIEMSSQRDLIKKFLPRIRSTKKCTTNWARITNKLAKDFCNFLGWSETDYRRFKSTGVAHRFQRMICKKMFDNINFKEIPGRALSSLVKGKFLDKHDLVDKYTEFIKSQPVAKFTGYPYELMKNMGSYSVSAMPLYKKLTIDKQFEQLLLNAKDNGKIKENVLCCLDTSGSMNCDVINNVSAGDIATSLAIYFSSLNTGFFKDEIIAFDELSRIHSLHGTFTEKVMQIKSDNDYMGSTNFQSVIDEIVRIRKNIPEIPISDYPTTLLAVSDMQFNSCNYWGKTNNETNLDVLLEKLADVFPQSYVRSLKFIWWQVTGRTNDVPATINDPGNILISGFDGSIISMILGEEATDQKEKTIPNMEDVAKDALNQEILALINR